MATRLRPSTLEFSMRPGSAQERMGLQDHRETVFEGVLPSEITIFES